MAGIVSGSVEFEWDGPGTPIATLERLLGTAFSKRREITDEYRDYDGGVVLGLRFWLELRYRGDSGYAATLAYRTDDPLYTTGGDTVNLDFHFIALLAAAGLKATGASGATER